MTGPSPWAPPTRLRRRIALALAVVALAPPALYAFLLRPIERDRQRQAAEAERLRREWESLAQRYQEVPIQVLLDRERMLTQSIMAERDRIEARAHTLRDGMRLSDIMLSGAEGRIDFKITLFEVRDRLGRIAEERGVQLPPDLGIAETIVSDEQAQMRFWQLAATVLLIEQCMEADIRVIHAVEAREPLQLPPVTSGLPGVVAYPVSLRFKATYERFHALLNALSVEPGFFAVRSFWIRRSDPADPDYLECHIVALALRNTAARMDDRPFEREGLEGRYPDPGGFELEDEG